MIDEALLLGVRLFSWDFGELRRLAAAAARPQAASFQAGSGFLTFLVKSIYLDEKALDNPIKYVTLVTGMLQRRVL